MVKDINQVNSFGATFKRFRIALKYSKNQIESNMYPEMRRFSFPIFCLLVIFWLKTVWPTRLEFSMTLYDTKSHLKNN